jgi:hypothetical protein
MIKYINKPIEFYKGSIAENLSFNYKNKKGNRAQIDLSKYCIIDKNSKNLTFEQIIRKTEQEQEKLDKIAMGNHRISYRASGVNPLDARKNRRGNGIKDI